MESNGRPKSENEMRVVVTFDMLTGEFGMDGADKNPVVALGMLDFALSRIRRVLGTNDVMREMANASRIAIPGGPLA